MTAIQEKVLSVPEIHCEQCVKAIDNVVGTLPGIQKVTTDVATKTVSLRYDSEQVSLEQVRASLDDAGYTVEG